jgi:hypothetical protein
MPAECFVCGVMDHYGLDVYYDPEHLPHWQCRPCAGGYWWRESDDKEWTLVFHGWEELVAQFRDEDEADSYVTWMNDNHGQ